MYHPTRRQEKCKLRKQSEDCSGYEMRTDRQAKLNKQTNKQVVSRLFGTSDRHPAQGWYSQLLMIILFDDPMNCQ